MTEGKNNSLKEDLKKDAISNSYYQITTENGVTTKSRQSDDYEFSVSTTSSQKKDKTYNVIYSKTVDEGNPDNKLIYTTTVLEIDGKREDYSKTETTIEKYDVNGGYKSLLTSTEREEDSYKNGNSKYVKTTSKENIIYEYGAVSTALGGKGQMVTSSTEISEEYYDKNGNVKKWEHNKEVSTPLYSTKTTSWTIYEKDVTKEYMKAQADSYGKFSLESSDFYAFKENGRETYNFKNEKDNTEIRFYNGEISGGIYSNVDGSKIKDLSDKALNKELKKARKEADKYIEKLTKGGAKSIDEYVARVPGANNYDVEVSLGAYFNTPLPSNYSEIKENMAQGYHEKFNNSDKNKNRTNLVAQMYMDRLQKQ